MALFLDLAEDMNSERVEGDKIALLIVVTLGPL